MKWVGQRYGILFDAERLLWARGAPGRGGEVLLAGAYESYVLPKDTSGDCQSSILTNGFDGSFAIVGRRKAPALMFH
jgi:hypothetical protein